MPRPGLQLFLRGQLLIQRFVRDDAGDTTTSSGAFVLQDFNRGLVSLGLAYVYPSL